MEKHKETGDTQHPFTGLPAGALRVLQITDTHLYADPAGSLLGLNTQQTFDLILQFARERVLPVDLLLLTGDLVHDASEAGYRRLCSQIKGLGAPAYGLPGNHDLPRQMDQILPTEGIAATGSACHGNWLIVTLDSMLEDDEGGHLRPSELARLDETLARHPDHHALIALHHQPVPVGSEWLDTMIVDNPGPFFEILDRHRNVRGVLFGHIHQQFDAIHRGLRLMGSPSTCIQFTPGKKGFGVEAVPPGVRLLALLPDGAIRTSVERLPKMPPGLHLHSGGYKGQ